MGIWLDDDLTEREKQIRDWLDSIVREERKNGLETRMGYMKIRVEGKWYEWDELKGRLEEKTFLGGKQN